MLSTSTSNKSWDLQHLSTHQLPHNTLGYRESLREENSSWIFMEEQLLHPAKELIQISSAKEGHNNTKTSQKR